MNFAHGTIITDEKCSFADVNRKNTEDMSAAKLESICLMRS